MYLKVAGTTVGTVVGEHRVVGVLLLETQLVQHAVRMREVVIVRGEMRGQEVVCVSETGIRRWLRRKRHLVLRKHVGFVELRIIGIGKLSQNVGTVVRGAALMSGPLWLAQMSSFADLSRNGIVLLVMEHFGRMGRVRGMDRLRL